MYINGRNAVLEAIRSGERIEKIYFLYGITGEELKEIRDEARYAGIPVSTLDKGKFRQLEKKQGVRSKSQGIIARLNMIDYADIMTIVSMAWEGGRVPLVVALDSITDPHNLGAIARSVECSGGDGLMFSATGSSGISDVVVKASAGAIMHLPVARSSRLEADLDMLAGSGLKVVGLDERGDMEYTEYDWNQPTVIVIGSEGDGISRPIRQLCDTMVSIPMNGEIASLNASVAAGVVLFEAARQRREKRRGK